MLDGWYYGIKSFKRDFVEREDLFLRIDLSENNDYFFKVLVLKKEHPILSDALLKLI